MKKTTSDRQPSLLSIPAKWLVLESYSDNPQHRTRYRVIPHTERRTRRRNSYRFRVLPETFSTEAEAQDYASVQLQLRQLEHPERYRLIPYPRVELHCGCVLDDDLRKNKYCAQVEGWISEVDGVSMRRMLLFDSTYLEVSNKKNWIDLHLCEARKTLQAMQDTWHSQEK